MDQECDLPIYAAKLTPNGEVLLGYKKGAVVRIDPRSGKVQSFCLFSWFLC